MRSKGITRTLTLSYAIVLWRSNPLGLKKANPFARICLCGKLKRLVSAILLFAWFGNLSDWCMSLETSPYSPSCFLPISACVALRPSFYLIFDSGVVPRPQPSYLGRSSQYTRHYLCSNILHRVRDRGITVSQPRANDVLFLSRDGLCEQST